MCVGGALVYVKAVAGEALQLQWLEAGRAETLIRTWQILAELLATSVLHPALVHVGAALVVGVQDEPLAAGAGAGVGAEAELLAAIVVDGAGIGGNASVLLRLLQRHAARTETLVASSRVEAVVRALVGASSALIDVLAAVDLAAVAQRADAAEGAVVLAVHASSWAAAFVSLLPTADALDYLAAVQILAEHVALRADALVAPLGQIFALVVATCAVQQRVVQIRAAVGCAASLIVEQVLARMARATVRANRILTLLLAHPVRHMVCVVPVLHNHETLINVLAFTAVL